MLRGVQQRSMVTSTAFMDDTVTTAPFGIAPTGIQKMAHEEGECATARGNTQMIFIMKYIYGLDSK